jgi:hypothetical protein
VIGCSCKTWSCPFCGPAKIARLARLVQEAKPNRLLTLTLDQKSFATPRLAFDETSRLVPELIKYLRLKHGPVEYLKVTELHRNGYPHYHLLVRSGYLPHAQIKSWWEPRTGGFRIDVRQVDQSFSSFKYVAKYLTKIHNLGWTDRHVSYSKSFFPTPPQPHKPASALASIERHRDHPWVHLNRWHSGQEVLPIGPSQWFTPELPSTTPTPCGPTDVGLDNYLRSKDPYSTERSLFDASPP